MTRRAGTAPRFPEAVGLFIHPLMRARDLRRDDKVKVVLAVGKDLDC